MYPAELVNPMKAEMTSVGFEEMLTPAKVDEVMQREGTTLVFFNSVCGCSAGTARPGVRIAIQHTKKPNNLTTVFAGFDVDSVKQARSYTLPYPPSSPCIALFKNGELVHFIERHHIEGRSAEMIAQNLVGAFEQYC
jgi:putative YphP/YqiW family bacilliredoxin